MALPQLTWGWISRQGSYISSKKNQPGGRIQHKVTTVSEAAKTNGSGTAQVRVLALKEGGKQVEEGMRSRGGAVPKQSKLWKKKLSV